MRTCLSIDDHTGPAQVPGIGVLSPGSEWDKEKVAERRGDCTSWVVVHGEMTVAHETEEWDWLCLKVYGRQWVVSGWCHARH